MYVQFGCGHCAPEGWMNFDASPTLRIERLPILGRIATKNASRFPPSVRYGDIVSGLPVPTGSVRGLYGSHVLEHLTREDFVKALENSFRLLAPGGIFRLIVPDLQARAIAYLADLKKGSTTANDDFLRSSGLGKEERPVTLLKHAIETFGKNSHLWMRDEPSMISALTRSGFTSIRRCAFGDSSDPMFSKVEDRGRFIDGVFQELAMEAKRSE